MKTYILKPFVKKVTKLKAQKSPTSRFDKSEDFFNKYKQRVVRNVFNEDPSKMPIGSVSIERARKIGRAVEAKKHISYSKKVETAFTNIVTKKRPNDLGSLIKRKNKALINAFNKSQKLGVKATVKAGSKMGIAKETVLGGAKDRPKTFYGSKNFISADESRKLGFPQSEMNLDAKYDYDIPSKSAKSRLTKTLKTYQNVKTKFPRELSGKKNKYNIPTLKTGKRSELKSFYKKQAKRELSEAKMDRAYFRADTIQKTSGVKFRTIKAGLRKGTTVKEHKYAKTIWDQRNKKKELIKTFVPGGKVKWE
jgi:hypothetical protein